MNKTSWAKVMEEFEEDSEVMDPEEAELLKSEQDEVLAKLKEDEAKIQAENDFANKYHEALDNFNDPHKDVILSYIRVCDFGELEKVGRF